uniref:Uncharacterized protein n=1 Tax=Phenylobacterium glaciei TaxID=2803784 RepID=A0A974P267_9CAUL|nr:hypothetical protein JKL49_24715 [Phenylobacterium glaciei]
MTGRRDVDGTVCPAEAALKAGNRDEGIRLTAEELTRDPDAPARVYQNFTAMLIRHQMYEQAEHWAQLATDRYPATWTCGTSWASPCAGWAVTPTA